MTSLSIEAYRDLHTGQAEIFDQIRMPNMRGAASANFDGISEQITTKPQQEIGGLTL
jgi:hypothetical protein